MAKKRVVRRAENRYAHLQQPQAVLDFHGLGPIDGGDVTRAFDRFLADARRRGLERLRIVTGRGLHSKTGRPLVRPKVAKLLARALRDGGIAGFHPERIDEGGDGAFVVTL